MDRAEEISQLLADHKNPAGPRGPYLSTGSTLLNLACSGRPNGGFSAGSIVHFFGSSGSGKTFVGLTLFSEAMRSKQFQDYRLIFDNAEDGALMDLAQFFGKKLADKIEAPAYDDDGPVFSSTVEEFYDRLDDAFGEGKPFVYLLDSMDVLNTQTDEVAHAENRKLREKGKNAQGSYGMSKAKLNKAGMRRVVSKLRKSGSILVIIGQAIQDVRFGAMPGSLTYSGGTAQQFFAHLQILSKQYKKLYRQVGKNKRQVGAQFKLKVTKNRLTGNENLSTIVDFYRDYGIDDIKSCVDYLIAERPGWKEGKGVLKAPDFQFAGKRDEFIALIESGSREKELRLLVAETWRKADEGVRVKRKPRYS